MIEEKKTEEKKTEEKNGDDENPFAKLAKRPSLPNFEMPAKSPIEK